MQFKELRLLTGDIREGIMEEEVFRSVLKGELVNAGLWGLIEKGVNLLEQMHREDLNFQVQ